MAARNHFTAQRNYPDAALALSYCRIHPDDDEVLVTSSAEGLAAINLPHYKAIIWKRRMPDNLKAALQNLTQTDIYNIDTNFCSAGALRQDFHGAATSLTHDGNRLDQLPAALANDLKLLHREFARVSNCKSTRGRLDLNPFTNRIIHADGLTTLRLHASYLSQGLEWFSIRPTRTQLYAMQDKKLPTPKGHMTQNGDVVFFKSCSHRVAEPRQPGFLHRNPDEKPGTRLIYILD